MNALSIVDRLRLDLDSFQREATAIRKLASGEQPKFYMSLYALLMGAFSQVDLLSQLWAGPGVYQTKRMVDFLERFTTHTPAAIRIAVHLYRHTLMHTGRPRELQDRATGQRHCFLLHWGAPPGDPAAHFTLDNNGKLTMNLEFLVNDLVAAFTSFAALVASDPTAAQRLVAAWPSIALQSFSAPAA